MYPINHASSTAHIDFFKAFVLANSRVGESFDFHANWVIQATPQRSGAGHPTDLERCPCLFGKVGIQGYEVPTAARKKD